MVPVNSTLAMYSSGNSSMPSRRASRPGRQKTLPNWMQTAPRRLRMLRRKLPKRQRTRRRKLPSWPKTLPKMQQRPRRMVARPLRKRTTHQTTAAMIRRARPISPHARIRNTTTPATRCAAGKSWPSTFHLRRGGRVLPVDPFNLGHEYGLAVDAKLGVFPRQPRVWRADLAQRVAAHGDRADQQHLALAIAFLDEEPAFTGHAAPSQPARRGDAAGCSLLRLHEVQHDRAQDHDQHGREDEEDERHQQLL